MGYTTITHKEWNVSPTIIPRGSKEKGNEESRRANVELVREAIETFQTLLMHTNVGNRKEKVRREKNLKRSIFVA